MGNTLSSTDDIVALVQLCEQDGVEEDGPDTVIRLLEADVLSGQVGRDEEETLLKAEGAGRRDLLYEEVEYPPPKPSESPTDSPEEPQFVVVHVDGERMWLEVESVDWGSGYAPYRSNRAVLRDSVP